MKNILPIPFNCRKTVMWHLSTYLISKNKLKNIKQSLNHLICTHIIPLFIFLSIQNKVCVLTHESCKDGFLCFFSFFSAISTKYYKCIPNELTSRMIQFTHLTCSLFSYFLAHSLILM